MEKVLLTGGGMSHDKKEPPLLPTADFFFKFALSLSLSLSLHFLLNECNSADFFCYTYIGIR